MDVSATSICNWKKRGLPQKRLEELLTEFPSLADFLSQVRFEPTVDKQIAFIESDIRKLIEAVGALLVGVSAIEARFGSYITHARVKK